MDKAETKEWRKSALVKTVRVSLVKPLDVDWTTAGRRLFDMRSVAHRLLNAGVRASLRCEEQVSCAVMKASREGVKDALRDERAYWTARIGKAHEGKNTDPDRAERFAEFALPSVVEDAIAVKAAKSYLDAKKHMLRGDKSIPSYKGGSPIYFRDGAGAWVLSVDDKGRYELALKLYPGRSPMVRFAVRVSGAGAYADLRRMLSEDVILGNALVVRNDRTKEWEARLSYSFTKPAAVRGEEVVAVHRGMQRFVTVVSTKAAQDFMPGDAYLAAKMALSARRRKLQMHTRKGELGNGARGHGRARRFKAVTELDDREARMVKSACQQSAAFTVRFALKNEASTVVIEDYSTIREETSYVPRWPWAQLKDAIAWACAKAGLELIEVSSAYISQTCPACERTDARNVVGKDVRNEGAKVGARAPRFRCVNPECGFDFNIDTVAAFNMLAVAAGPEPVKRMRERLARMSASMRERNSDDEAAQ